MKTFSGIVRNFKEPILGRIISNDSDSFKRADEIKLSSEIPLDLNEYKAIISNINIDEKHIRKTPFFKVDNCNLISGDIVLLEPKGIGTILYELNSKSNSLLLTEKCNFHCRMCPQIPKNSDDEDFIDLSIKIIRLIKKEPEYICITGGEPTILWEGLEKVIAEIYQYLPNTKILLLTNGRNLKEFLKVKRLSDLGSEKIFIGISLYSDNAQIHDSLVGIKGAFWDTAQGIYNLERVNISVEIRTVIFKQNAFRLPQWSEFIYRTFPFVSHVVFMGMEPFGNALNNFENLWIDPSEYMACLEKAIRDLYRRGMNISLYNFQLCTLPKELWKFSKDSISEWKKIFIDKCQPCRNIMNCPGFFESAAEKHSKMISPII